MKHLIIIACLWTITYSQSPATPPEIWWNGEYNAKGDLIQAGADSSQKARAELIYEYGVRYGDRGHTAVALGWTETSLGADTTHDEDSHKDFGLSEIALLDIGCTTATYDSLEAGLLSLERQAVLALDYWTLCYERLLGAGLSPYEAYFWTYPKYSTGSNYLRFRRRGEVFRMRLRFLVSVVFPPDNN